MIYTQVAKDPGMADARRQSLLLAVKEKRLHTLIIEPSGKCNLTCTFCDLQSGRLENVEHLKGVMPFETFQRAIDGQVELGSKLKQLQYIGNGEPLVNKHLPQFVAYASDRGVAERQRVITNGTILTPTVLKNLTDAGVSIIDVSLDTVDRDRYQFLKGKDLLQAVEDNILNAIEYVRARAERGLELHIKCATPHPDGRYGFTLDDMNAVVEKYRQYADGSPTIHIKTSQVVLVIDGMREGGAHYNTACEIPFYSATVRADGSVVACCSDVMGFLKIGNIMEQSLGVILAGEELRAIRKMHLEQTLEKLPICYHCENRTAVDLSPIADEMMEHI